MLNTYIGCAVWGHKSWVGTWFPASTKAGMMLEEYSKRLSMVEINATFYGIPDSQTIERWIQQTPQHFQFCPKVPRSISHADNLNNTPQETELFIERIKQFKERLGSVFLQLSPSFDPNRGNELIAWLETWPQDLPLAVEVRHPGWYQARIQERFNSILEEKGISRVIVDSRAIFSGSGADELVRGARKKKPDVPLQQDRPTGWSLVRFMGHLDQTINDHYLMEWVDTIAEWDKAGHTTYFAMHCPNEDYSPGMGYRLAEALEKRGLTLNLAQPDIEPEPEPEQLKLL